jgi:hypothetical protein
LAIKISCSKSVMKNFRIIEIFKNYFSKWFNSNNRPLDVLEFVIFYSSWAIILAWNLLSIRNCAF